MDILLDINDHIVFWKVQVMLKYIAVTGTCSFGIPLAICDMLRNIIDDIVFWKGEVMLTYLAVMQ